jgi:propanol-preferring alcohol dehydrogenase
MRAMILEKPQSIEKKPLKLQEWPEPQPGFGQIKLSIQACGVCHTDLHTVEGDLYLPTLPLIPGHQVVGMVEDYGEEAKKFKIGQRVGVPWLFQACGQCEFCTQGHENLCKSALFTGLQVQGGYAESLVVYEDFAYPLPDHFSDAAAAPLLCGGIIGYRALRLSEVKAGQRLGLYGFGGSAHITIQLARHMGCEVYVFTRSESHKKLARELGAVWTGDASDTPPRKMHGSIIFAPAGRLAAEALRHLERGGTVTMAGVTMTPLPQLDYDELLYWEKNLRSVANFTRQDAEELLKLAAEIPVHTTIQTFPLAEANEVLLALKQSKIDGTAVLLCQQ